MAPSGETGPNHECTDITRRSALYFITYGRCVVFPGLKVLVLQLPYLPLPCKKNAENHAVKITLRGFPDRCPDRAGEGSSDLPDGVRCPLRVPDSGRDSLNPSSDMRSLYRILGQ
jgi:hypothetical protein